MSTEGYNATHHERIRWAGGVARGRAGLDAAIDFAMRKLLAGQTHPVLSQSTTKLWRGVSEEGKTREERVRTHPCTPARRRAPCPTSRA